MIDPHQLIQSFKLTHWLIHQQAKGLSHAESVLQLPFRGNCFNWVLGHIVNGRNLALALLDEAPTLAEAEAARYRSGAEAITQAENAVPLERLLSALDEALARLTSSLERVSPERLADIYDESRQQTVGDRLAGLHWHETYHTGQLELLRQLAGKNDQVV
jgi:uncharacterized damage-inducible protein DinB